MYLVIVVKPSLADGIFGWVMRLHQLGEGYGELQRSDAGTDKRPVISGTCLAHFLFHSCFVEEMRGQTAAIQTRQIHRELLVSLLA